MTISIPTPDENNAWRTQSPGSADWPRSPHPEAPNKYFMVSADGHVQEPRKIFCHLLTCPLKEFYL